MSILFRRAVSYALIVCLAGLPAMSSAGPLPTDAVANAEQSRAAVLAFVERSEIAAQLETLGLTAQAARERVAALTDAEARKLSGEIERLPAGADGAGLGILLVLLFLTWRFVIEPWLYPKEDPKAAKPAAKKEPAKKEPAK